ncbi:MAG: aminopeptidase [Paucibacter sp.]|nr:aminopeptidase [Roseateles sp.]
MLSKIFAFEARYQLRSPLFLISFVIFFLMSFGAITSTDIQIGGPKGSSHLNSPYAILEMIATMNLMAIFIVTAFVANVVIRDEEFGFAAILRSTRVSKFDYLVGRFLGAMFVAFLVTTAVPLGVLIGSLMPWLDAEQLGPLVLEHYVFGQLVMSVPTLLVLGAGFFALATITRSMMWTYVGAVAFIVLFGASRVLLKDPSLDMASGLADPFAIGALNRVTKYWTAADRNTLLPSLSGMLLYNRLIWLSVAAALFALAYRLFHFETAAKAAAKAENGSKNDTMPSPKRLANPSHGGRTAWLQLRALTRFDMRFVFKSPAFFVLLAIGVLNALAGLLLTTSERGVAYLPVTRSVVDALEGSFGIIPLLIAIYYAGELVWRDRERRMHEIVDASAAPNWAFLCPKVLAISGVLLACYLTAMLTGILFQLGNGFTQIQPAAYLLWLVLPGLISAVLLSILAIFVQAMVPHKFVGWALMMVLMVLGMVMGSLGFEHRLYTFAGMPEVPLSDMNEMGRFWIGRAWHQAYWLAFGAMLLVATHLMWRRGVETRLQPRLSLLRQRLAGTPGLLLGAATLAWVSTGGYIYYNSNVLNEYVTAPAEEQRQADYEKTLWGFAELPQPTITDVKLKVELYPKQARADIAGSYQMENRSGRPISQVHVQWAPGLQVQAMALDGAVLEKEYKDLAHRIYRLSKPLQAGDKLGLSFAIRMEQEGFVNSKPQTQIVPNGSFISNQQFAPMLGVPRGLLLQDRAKRRKHGLPPEMRVAQLEDNSANAHNYLRHDSDLVNAEITLSTDADQTPIAPGTTVSDSTANGRRTIVTRSDAPTAHFFSMQSARYQKASDSWAGKDGKTVALQIYHHPTHNTNVQRMFTAMKASLDLYSEQFSPYQFKQARIMEFPAYERFAQAFAATVPFSEAIGFIQNFKDEDRAEKVDLVTFVTAHEMAHQWWGHQINSAEKQGMTLLSESFAQYSALLVMEKLYGKEQIRKFLKFELDRYLSGRAGEAVEELPLARVENQAYIHYRKGAVVMYSLKEIVGEAAVNRALQKLLAEFAFKPAPYADTRDFLRLLRAEAGPEHEALIVDLFEKITLFDLKATDAKATRRADGKFEVSFTVDAKKLYADGKGKETESPLNEALDIGAFSAEPGKKGFTRDSVLLMERRPLKSGKQQITLLLDKAPAWVGVDPYNMRIDRNSDDNLTKVHLN